MSLSGGFALGTGMEEEEEEEEEEEGGAEGGAGEGERELLREGEKNFKGWQQTQKVMQVLSDASYVAKRAK